MSGSLEPEGLMEDPQLIVKAGNTELSAPLSLGLYLDILLAIKNQSQKDLANQAQVSRPYISRIMREDRSLNPATLDKIALSLNLSDQEREVLILLASLKRTNKESFFRETEQSRKNTVLGRLGRIEEILEKMQKSNQS